MSAVISHCGHYRYTLDRAMGNREPILLFVMLNPSTADAELDDQTIRKCKGFAARLGYERLRVINLYAWRSTKPSGLAEAKDPVGPSNDVYIAGSIVGADRVIVAWGGHALPKALDKAGRIAKVQEIAARHGGRDLECLGTTADGSPRHPCMLAYATPLERWAP